MILPDFRIKTHCQHGLIEPFIEANLQPASVDLTLANDFKFLIKEPWTGSPEQPIDLFDIAETTADMYLPVELDDGDSMWLEPKQFVLGRTQERVNVPADLVARVEGKSSLGRLGLLVHATAGFIDPGFHGTITLEFYNLGIRPIMLSAGLRICQISFTSLEAPAMKPYGSDGLGSRYQDQVETTVSRYAG